MRIPLFTSRFTVSSMTWRASSAPPRKPSAGMWPHLLLEGRKGEKIDGKTS
jgi:hypothetical protein